jgi:1-acyl-sn-glycerol-3-phosphate acyltransferase
MTADIAKVEARRAICIRIRCRHEGGGPALTKPFKMLSRALASAPEGVEGRDPEFIRDTLPHLWLAVQLYFRAEVHGFEHVPDEPVLFVGNHSGGANTPDTFMFTLAYHTFMTVEGRPLVALAHEVIVRIPVIGDIARKYGMVQAGQSAAGELLAEGANVLVYPGRCRGVAALEGPQQDRVRRSERLPQAGP